MSDLRATLAKIETHNGSPVSAHNLRWAATHEALCRSFIFDVLMALADALEAPPATGAVTPSRRTDPDTSRKAEPTPVKAGTQRARLLAAFALEEAADGLTDEEAADLADGVPYRSEFAKRCSELRAAGLITVVTRLDTLEPFTRAGVAGHQRIVSAITDAGRAVVASLPKPDASATVDVSSQPRKDHS